MENISPHFLARYGHDALLARCDGADLLVLDATEAGYGVLSEASIPVLFARPTAPDTEVTDRIVVASDNSPASGSAAELAGLLAAGRGEVVAIVPVPEPDPGFQRAIAASARIVHGVTGTVSQVLGDPVPPERALPAAAATLGASLLVLPMGTDGGARTRAALIAQRAGCSVLVVPAVRSNRHSPPSDGARFGRQGRAATRTLVPSASKRPSTEK